MSAIALKRLRSLQMRNWDPFWVSLYAQNWRLFGRAKSKKRKEFAGCLVHIPVHPFSGALDLITLGKKIGVSNGINFISSSGRMEKKNLDPIKIQDIHFFCQCSQGGAHLGPVADQLQGTYIIFSGCGFQSGLHLLCFACPLPCLCGFSPGTAIISSHIAKAEDFHLSLSIQMFFSHLIGSPPLSNSFASYLNQRIILSRPMPTLKSLILMEIRQVSLISLYQLMRPVDLDITFSKWKTNKNNNNNKKDSTKHVCPAEDVRSSDRHFDSFQRRTSDICTSLRQYDDLVCFCLLFFLFVFCVSLASFMSKHHKWTWLETSCASRSFV